MTVEITDAMLAQVGTGAHTLENVGRVRRILAAAGVEDVELHKLEIQQIRLLRAQQAELAAAAEKLFAAGPMPFCRCEPKDDGSGLIGNTYGCKLGHRPGTFPDEVK